MTKNRKIGTLGEAYACEILQSQDYIILHRNWTFKHKEIDIIALSSDQILVFIEVKTRSGRKFGFPELHVTAAQQHHITQAALHYIEVHPHKYIRFDIIAIQIDKHQVTDYLHIRDAFY